MNVLMFDIENVLDKMDESTFPHTIRKMFYYFNKSSVEGKYAKPFLLKFYLSTNEEELCWSVNTIYQNLSYIPKFLISSSVITTDFNCIDTSNKIFSIKNAESIKKYSVYDEEAYEFEVNFGSALVDQSTINSLCEILESHDIQYEFDNEQSPLEIILYPSTSTYQLHISLNGKINKAHQYEIMPFIDKYNNQDVIGKFTMFKGKSTPIPNDDNLGLFKSCSHCHSTFIINWWSYNGTTCPYCNHNNSIFM